MEALTNSLHECTISAINEYTDKLIKAGLIADKNKALSIWNESSSANLKVTETPKVSKKRSKDEVSADVKKCQYIYVKGKNPGKPCGSKISSESESGNFCKKHITHEQSKNKKEEKPLISKKTAATQPKKESSASKKKDESSSPVIKQVTTNTPGIQIEINKFRNYAHEDTGLVFDRKDREVCGRQHIDGNVIPLTLADIEICKQHGFKFKIPPNLTIDEEEQPEDELEEEITDEEELDEDEELEE